MLNLDTDLFVTKEYHAYLKDLRAQVIEYALETSDGKYTAKLFEASDVHLPYLQQIAIRKCSPDHFHELIPMVRFHISPEDRIRFINTGNPDFIFEMVERYKDVTQEELDLALGRCSDTKAKAFVKKFRDRLTQKQINEGFTRYTRTAEYRDKHDNRYSRSSAVSYSNEPEVDERDERYLNEYYKKL